MKQNTFKYWEHPKAQPFSTGRELSLRNLKSEKQRSPISEQGSPGGGHRVAVGLPQSQSPFSAGQQAALDPLGAGMRLKASWAPQCLCTPALLELAVETQLGANKTQLSLCGSSVYNKNCLGVTSIRFTNRTASHTLSSLLPCGLHAVKTWLKISVLLNGSCPYQESLGCWCGRCWAEEEKAIITQCIHLFGGEFQLNEHLPPNIDLLLNPES